MGKAELIVAEDRNRAFSDQIREFSKRNAEAKGDKSTEIERDRRLPSRSLHLIGGGHLSHDWQLFSLDALDRTPEELQNPETWANVTDYATNRPLRPRDEVVLKTRPDQVDGSWWRGNFECIGIKNQRPLFRVYGLEKIEAAGAATVTHYGPGISIHEIGHVFELMHNGVVTTFTKFEDARKQAESLQRKT